MTIARSTHAKKNGTQFTAQSGSRAVSKSLADAFDNVSYPQQSVARPPEIAHNSIQRYASPAPSDVSGDHANAYGGSTAVYAYRPVYATPAKLGALLCALAGQRVRYPAELLDARRAAFQSLIQERTY